ncbi:hypothetical protein OHR68_13890 [Spirillospora sp. NBC_00431]
MASTAAAPALDMSAPTLTDLNGLTGALRELKLSGRCRCGPGTVSSVPERVQRQRQAGHRDSGSDRHPHRRYQPRQHPGHHAQGEADRRGDPVLRHEHARSGAGGAGGVLRARLGLMV